MIGGICVYVCKSIFNIIYIEDIIDIFKTKSNLLDKKKLFFKFIIIFYCYKVES